jgi:hypothetical protein
MFSSKNYTLAIASGIALHSMHIIFFIGKNNPIFYVTILRTIPRIEVESRVDIDFSGEINLWVWKEVYGGYFYLRKNNMVGIDFTMKNNERRLVKPSPS